MIAEMQMVREFHEKHDFWLDQPLSRVHGGPLNDRASNSFLMLAAKELQKLANDALDRFGTAHDPRLMRLHLIAEELGELCDSMAVKDEVAFLDAVTDLAYVVIGTAITFREGRNLDEAFRRVSRSNLSKVVQRSGDDQRRTVHPKGNTFVAPKLEDLV